MEQPLQNLIVDSVQMHPDIAAADVHCHLETPFVDYTCSNNSLSLAGWVLCGGAADSFLEIECRDEHNNLENGFCVPVDSIRRDVAFAFPQYPNSTSSGFSVAVALDRSRNTRTVVVSLVTSTGARHELWKINLSRRQADPLADRFAAFVNDAPQIRAALQKRSDLLNHRLRLLEADITNIPNLV